MGIIKKIKEVKALEKKQPKLDEAKKNAQKVAKARRTLETQVRKENRSMGRPYGEQRKSPSSTKTSVIDKEDARRAKEAAVKKAAANKATTAKLKAEIRATTSKMKLGAKGAGVAGAALTAFQLGKDALRAVQKAGPIKDKLTAEERRATRVKASKAKTPADKKSDSLAARKKILAKRK